MLYDSDQVPKIRIIGMIGILLVIMCGMILIYHRQKTTPEYIKFFEMDQKTGKTKIIEYDENGTWKGETELNVLFCGLERNSKNNKILGAILDEKMNMKEISEYNPKTKKIQTVFSRNELKEKGAIVALHYVPDSEDISFAVNYQTLYRYKRKEGDFHVIKNAEFEYLFQHEWLDAQNVVLKKPLEVQRLPEVSIIQKSVLICLDINTQTEKPIIENAKRFSCSPDKQKIAVLDSDKKVYIYDMTSGEKKHIATLRESNTSLLFSPDGNKLLFYDIKRGFFSHDSTQINYMYDCEKGKLKKVGNMNMGSYYPGMFYYQGVW